MKFRSEGLLSLDWSYILQFFILMDSCKSIVLIMLQILMHVHSHVKTTRPRNQSRTKILHFSFFFFHNAMSMYVYEEPTNNRNEYSIILYHMEMNKESHNFNEYRNVSKFQFLVLILHFFCTSIHFLLRIKTFEFNIYKENLVEAALRDSSNAKALKRVSIFNTCNLFFFIKLSIGRHNVGQTLIIRDLFGCQFDNAIEEKKQQQKSEPIDDANLVYDISTIPW